MALFALPPPIGTNFQGRAAERPFRTSSVAGRMRDVLLGAFDFPPPLLLLRVGTPHLSDLARSLP